MERWLSTNGERPNRLRWIRVDLRRSLRMHRRLAIGVALAAMAGDAIWLFASWPQPAANAASAMVHAVLCLLTPIALSLMATVTARNLDQKIYDGADVESLLRVKPIGELPDFAEVPGEYGEVDLLRLANEMAHSCKKGRVRRCVITGTGHGTGVTTIALRLKESLDTLDRPAALVDASGAPHAAVEPSEKALRAAGLTVGFSAARESEGRRTEMILTDAEPIALSPDTEYLARFADCVLVVVESGVTTRGELHRTASCLEKLNVATVRFVVNRVKQSYSGRRLSEPIAALGVAPGQFATAVRRALADPAHRSEKDSPPIRTAAEPEKIAKTPKKPETTTALMKRVPQESPWNAPGIPPWLSDALAQLEKEAARRQTAERPVRATPGEAEPSQQVPAAESDEPAIKELKALTQEDHLKGKESESNQAEAMLFSMDLNMPVPENESLAPAAGAENARTDGQRTEKRQSRLSGLRGMVSATDLRALNQPKQAEATPWSVANPHSAVPSSLIGALTDTPGRLTGLKGLVTPADLKELNQGRPHLPQASGAGEPVPATAQSAAGPEPRIVEVRPKDAGPRADAAPSKPPKSVRPERDASFDEVQILPSKRGQYKRKK
jgi:hypothetical protein